MIGSLLRCLLSLLLVVTSLPVLAQTAAAPDYATLLDGATDELSRVDGALDTRLERSDRDDLRGRAQAVRATTLDTAQQLAGEMARIDARLAQLGPAASGEDPAIRDERATLTKQRTTIDSATKRAKLLSVEAQQLIDEIQEGQAAELNQKLFGRGASPLTPAFWSAILRSVPRDAHRIERFVAAEVAAVRGADIAQAWPAVLGFVIAILLLGPARLAAARVGQRLLIEGAPGRRVRRSANALGRILVGTLAPLLAAAALLTGARWAGLVAARWDAMLDQWLVAIGFAAFSSAVLGATLMRRSPSWRIAPVSDAVATRFRPYSFLHAGLAGGAIALDAADSAIGTSTAIRIATHSLLALAYILLIAGTLFALGRMRVEASVAEEGGADAPVHTGLAAMTLFAWGIAGVALLALVAGYVGFSLFVG